jgi:hypothetical protein
MPRDERQGHGHGFRFDERQVAMEQRQRSGDHPNHRQGCTKAKEPHRRDATHGWRPALPSRSRRGGRLCVGDWSPEHALNSAIALGAALPNTKRRAERRSAFRLSESSGIFPTCRIIAAIGSGRNLLLHGEPARPPFRSVGDADRPIARRGSPGARPRTLPHRRLGRPSRSSALPVDLALRRCRLSRSVARNQNRICEIFAYWRVTITGHDQPRRTGHLAASLLGAHDTRRSGLCGAYALHALQSGEARSRRAPGGLAIFVVSSGRRRRPVS